MCAGRRARNAANRRQTHGNIGLFVGYSDEKPALTGAYLVSDNSLGTPGTSMRADLLIRLLINLG